MQGGAVDIAMPMASNYASVEVTRVGCVTIKKSIYDKVVVAGCMNPYMYT